MKKVMIFIPLVLAIYIYSSFSDSEKERVKKDTNNIAVAEASKIKKAQSKLAEEVKAKPYKIVYAEQEKLNALAEQIQSIEAEVRHSNLLNEAKTRNLAEFEMIYLKDKIETLGRLRREHSKIRYATIQKELEKLEQEL